jgi:hypothetical protein
MLFLKSLLYYSCGISSNDISEKDTRKLFLCRKVIQKISVGIVTETVFTIFTNNSEVKKFLFAIFYPVLLLTIDITQG